MKPSRDNWPEFTQKNPVKVKMLSGGSMQVFNEELIS